jgi:hypothetical protein
MYVFHLRKLENERARVLLMVIVMTTVPCNDLYSLFLLASMSCQDNIGQQATDSFTPTAPFYALSRVVHRHRIIAVHHIHRVGWLP